MNIDEYLKPPVITERIIKRRFWFNKIEYWIEWEFCSQGPFNSYSDAIDIINMYYDAAKL